MHDDLILVIVVVAALAFDFTNGFHDTANVVATSISTHAMSPRLAVGMASVLNFVGAFISLQVAATVASDVVQADAITPTVIFAGLVGAIAWNLVTWYFGLPSSSSHALDRRRRRCRLRGGGSERRNRRRGARQGPDPRGHCPDRRLHRRPRWRSGSPTRSSGRLRPGPVNRGFRHGQVVSSGLLSLAHGTNDAQKTMGVITLALIANGNLSSTDFTVPTWVVVTSASAIAAGTYIGGWRIIRTMGTRIIKMDTAQGFTAQGAGAGVILASSHFGYPLSTTQVITGAVMGAGAGKRVSAVRWGLAGNIFAAWIVTLPAAAAVGALAYGFTSLFGDGAAGPLLVLVLSAALGVALFSRRIRRGQPVPST